MQCPAKPLGVWRIAVVLVGLTYGRAAAQVGRDASAGHPPEALTQAGEDAENLYDFANARDWTRARAREPALRTALEHLRSERDIPDSTQDRLEGEGAAVRRFIAAERRQSAMLAANRVTLDVANLSAPYHPTVPVEVARLDYYGRELEIWSGARDTTHLKDTAKGIRREWDALSPAATARSPAVARRFGALVARVERARAPAEYGRLATPILDEVDALENAFPH
jgi:hypothetical protein